MNCDERPEDTERTRIVLYYYEETKVASASMKIESIERSFLQSLMITIFFMQLHMTRFIVTASQHRITVDIGP